VETKYQISGHISLTSIASSRRKKQDCRSASSTATGGRFSRKLFEVRGSGFNLSCR